MDDLNRTGPMPKGGTYQEFVILLARLRRTFEPLRDREDVDGRDFQALGACLNTLAVRHRVPDPCLALTEQPALTGFATPNEVFKAVMSISSLFGLKTDEDAQVRTRIGTLTLGIFRRRLAPDGVQIAKIFAEMKGAAS